MKVPAILLCDDLIFSSRITGTARSLGIEMRVVRTWADLLALDAPRLVILDLSNPGLDLPALFNAFKQAPDGPPFVVAFGSHVDVRGLQAARDAGCDLVLPRSKFVDELPRKLATWLAGSVE